MIKAFEEDTLFLHADTLKAIGNNNQKPKVKSKKGGNIKKGKAEEKQEDSNTLFLAYHKVKFIKKDFQGKCDSLFYSINDSIMKLYGKPTFWLEDNQLTADSAKIHTGNKSLKSIELQGNGFLVTKEDSIHYNQIRGKKMQGYFKGDTLSLIKVQGNGQTIYYIKEKEEINAVNKADCSNLDIYLKEKKIDRIVFITKPDATLFPIDQVDEKDMKLKGFLWRGEQRPLKFEDIFIW